MSQYKVIKTTMGRKYKVLMSEQEIADRDLYRTAVIVIPFVCSALMFFLWVKMG